MAGIAGAVHYKFYIFRAVGFLKPGAEKHAQGAKTVDSGGPDWFHRDSFLCGFCMLFFIIAVRSTSFDLCDLVRPPDLVRPLG